MPTVAEALAAFQQAHNLDPAESASWACPIGPVTLRLPNFAWRRAAIQHHDLHHVLTGYPCTVRGECQMATWEFAAGQFPHAGATLFCLPLVAVGLIWSPQSIWSAFRRGREGRSLYGVELTEPLLRSPVATLREWVGRPPESPACAADIISFGWLVLRAWLLVMVPVGVFGSLILELAHG